MHLEQKQSWGVGSIEKDEEYTLQKTQIILENKNEQGGTKMQQAKLLNPLGVKKLHRTTYFLRLLSLFDSNWLLNFSKLHQYQTKRRDKTHFLGVRQ